MRAKVKKVQAESWYKKLKRENNDLRVTMNSQREAISHWQSKASVAERASQHRVDQTMLKERIDLARAIGQLVEATSKAVMFVVAKEAI